MNKLTAFCVGGILLCAASSDASGTKFASAPDELASSSASATSSVTAATSSAFEVAAWNAVDLGSVDTSVFERALGSAQRAVELGEADPGTLTVIDFSKPSTEPRLWVYDLRERKLLFEEHVAHGRNSGFNVATKFSNEPESNMSSLGLYRAAEPYIGKHGYSLRLDGLERGFNDRARERAIVIHGAEYVNEKTAHAQGRLGRSLGCPAVRPDIAHKLIDAVKNGGLVFAYYPDARWLKTSKYLD
jgi:hypothetical protein